MGTPETKGVTLLPAPTHPLLPFWATVWGQGWCPNETLSHKGYNPAEKLKNKKHIYINIYIYVCMHAHTLRLMLARADSVKVVHFSEYDTSCKLDRA